MLDSLFNDTTIPLLQKVAQFGERRHEVLAGNLANIDTPDYKTRDLSTASFQKALTQAVKRQTQAAPVSPHPSPFPPSLDPPPLNSQTLLSQSTAGTSDRSIDDLFPSELFQAAESAPHNITFQDGGNRSVEHEIMEMTKNSMMQQLAVQMMTSQMSMLQAVISERA